MRLIKVDVVRLQPFQTLFHGVCNLFTVEDKIAVPDMGAVAAGAGNLGGDDDIGAVAPGLHPGADDPFGITLGLGLAWKGIGFR